MRVHHLAFRSGDLEALFAFYSGVLGFPEIARQGGRSVWLAAGETILMLERAGAGEATVPRGSMELVAFATTPEALPRQVAQLAAAGVATEGETAFSVYFRDPDGRRIGLSHYPAERTSG